MPHLLTSILARAAVAVIEALALRLLSQLWKNFTSSGQPMAAGA
ncbi:hypothetical protein ACIHCQ_44040 [Streptomyces sp. NPDC052236]